MIRTFTTALLLLSCSQAIAQDKVITNFFKEVDASSVASKNVHNIKGNKFRVLAIDLNQLYTELENVPHRNDFKAQAGVQIELPQADGSTKLYQVMENSTLPPELSIKFPTIKTYDAYGIDNPGELVKFDLTNHGFHAMILSPGKSPVFIDPLKRGATQYYIIYKKKDFISKSKLRCEVHGQSQLNSLVTNKSSFTDFNSCELKTYRLAMAATAQYTAFAGGTINDALSAQVTTINRVNGIYETDMAITLQFIPNNNLIIYTDPNNQPYTHGIPKLLINENQLNVTKVIGAAHYDIGHVVDSAGSGLAQLRSVCNDELKAEGVTGTTAPVGDPFDVDFVAHEMGHQFGANHVQNNDCNRNDDTAVEPGSGSTIMGYAGICKPNVQAHSDAYFNGISLQEMGDFVSSPGHTCPVKTPIPHAPVIHQINGNVTIPANTPFALTALATHDSNGVLTYSWEQMDNEVTPQPPINTATGGPNFRSFTPQTPGTRFFPNLNALSQNGPFTWEVIPSVSRVMNFRVSVRGNTPGGSCNAYRDTRLITDSMSGPFLVTYPSATNIKWIGYSSQTVSWNVANTNSPPVAALKVNILLSTNGGQTFPYTLASNVANNGSYTLCVPNIGQNTARIMVQSSNGAFFNMSQKNFSIIAVPAKAPTLTAADRNGMNPKEAFILYSDCISVLSSDKYTVNGLPGTTVRLDLERRRFVIGNITTPKKVRNVTITATDSNNVKRTSNPITIPSIL